MTDRQIVLACVILAIVAAAILFVMNKAGGTVLS